MEVGAYTNLCKTFGSVTVECIHKTNVILASKLCGKPTSFGSSRRLHLRSYVSKSLCGRSKTLKVIASDEGAPGIINGSKQQDNDIANSNNGVSLAEDVFIIGRRVQGNSVCRQHFVIRSYEVGADMNESIETLMNHLQETGLSHVRVIGLNGGGLGNTHEMRRLNLIWVITRMQVHVDRYSSWGDIVEIDTWITRAGKNSVRRDWLVRDYKTGYILAKATRSNSDNDIAENLGHWFHSAYIYAAMTDYPVAANFIQPLPAYPVKQMCKAIDNPSGSTDLLNRLYRGAVLALIYDRVILMGMLAGDFEI